MLISLISPALLAFHGQSVCHWPHSTSSDVEQLFISVLESSLRQSKVSYINMPCLKPIYYTVIQTSWRTGLWINFIKTRFILMNHIIWLILFIWLIVKFIHRVNVAVSGIVPWHCFQQKSNCDRYIFLKIDLIFSFC